MKSIIFLAALTYFGLSSSGLPTNATLIDDLILSHGITEQRSLLSATCTYSSGPFKDGEGTWSTSDGDQKIKVNHGPEFHCWNDYFAMDVLTYSTSWLQASGDVYCTSTTTCSHAVAASTQYCVTTTQENSIAVTASLQDSFTKIFSATLGVTYTYSWSTAQQNCNNCNRYRHLHVE